MTETQEPKFPELEREIKELKEEFAKPLMAEVIVTPLMDLVTKIMDLPDSLEGRELGDIHRIEREVKECQRELEAISFYYVNRVISKPTPSKVFRILANANLFESRLRRHVGKKIKMESGEEMPITPALIEALTRYRFSIGTPPVTPKGIDTIERIIFGGTLKDIYAFRELLGGDRIAFDRLVGDLSRMVEESTHYTTAREKGNYEREAAGFPNFEGLRRFQKSIVTGTPATAIRLISEQLCSKHSSGSRPVRVVRGRNSLDDRLIDEMKRNQELIFVVPMSRVPHGTFATDKIDPKWNGVIGRLVIVDDSREARSSGTTCVYSFLPSITDTLNKLHVKDSGTPANTQMNLRRIVESFRGSDLTSLRSQVDRKLKELEGEAKDPQPGTRRHQWKVEARKDYVCLKKFKGFLDFLVTVKEGDEGKLKELETRLSRLTTERTMRYFFKELEAKGYKGIVVPQGGGRREIGHIGNYFAKKSADRLEEFRRTKLALCRQKLAHLRASRGGYAANDPETLAEQRGTRSMRSLDDRLRLATRFPSAIGMRATQGVRDLFHDRIVRTQRTLAEVRSGLTGALSANLPGELRARVEAVLADRGVGAVGKQMERGRFRQAGNLYRNATGTAFKTAAAVLDEVDDFLRGHKRGLEEKSLELVDALLNDIEKGCWMPSLAQPEIGWTFNDVIDEERFPKKNYIHISLGSDGQMDPASLERQLEDVREQLIHFPELFELYCSRILLIVNDPHNPTAKVASNDVKLRLLDIASKYKIEILADAAYHKQVKKSIKTKQGDFTLAEFYEINRSRFPNPVVIHTSLPTTKWSIGGGKRTGAIVSNDPGMIDYVTRETDGVNTMSLYMDSAELNVGIVVKKVCKELEETIVWNNPRETIDRILETHFGNIDDSDFAAPVYFALLQARNDLDRLRIRGAGEMEYRQYMSGFITDLKALRLDKLTQKDTVERAKAVEKAIDRMEGDFPGLKERCIMPDGPFYFMVKLDNARPDPDLQMFLEGIAQARFLDVISTDNGYVRFSLGGLTDGTTEGYDVLSLAIETNLRVLLEYWKLFKGARARLTEAKDSNPKESALKELFPGGEIEFMRTARDKKALISRLETYKEKRRGQVAFGIPANVTRYISQIEPGNATRVVTLSGINCGSVEEMIRSKQFTDLFNYYLTLVRPLIPELQHLDDQDTIAHFGARQFAQRFETRIYANKVEEEIFKKIAREIAKKWFGPETMKFLANEARRDVTKRELFGEEGALRTYIKLFLLAFLDESTVNALVRSTFQAGYRAVDGVRPSENLPGWCRALVGSTRFALSTAATELSPAMTTAGKARVPGVDRGIARRDGNGEDKPHAGYFSGRLNSFMETVNPDDYVCKLIQVGVTKILFVMNKAYEPYIVEELRLLPQYDLSPEEMANCNPDGVSFLGLPAKVMGENFRVGYYFDKKVDGRNFPVTWVDGENITDYMGYLKKPILTAHNEIVTEIGGEGIHGSAFTIVYKNGLRKTVVVAGDSGTGKSETLIAMRNMIRRQEGVAEEVDHVELLAGDMLSMFIGSDGEPYLFGTEQGDFMRMDDIPEDWIEYAREKVASGSATNLDNPQNKRITIGGLCDPKEFLRPTHINVFLVANNYEMPSGQALRETDDPTNLIPEYVRGYRGEKGTSGDQPNLYASISHTDKKGYKEVLDRHGERLDELLDWEVLVGPSGKADNAFLRFTDKEGEVFRAHRMVRDIFVGRAINYQGEDCTITDTKYDVARNRYRVVIKNEKGEEREVNLDRDNVFRKLFKPIAATYCGNPFVDAENMRRKHVLQRFTEAMRKAGTITGTIYTQLKVDGREFAGPADAARDLIEFFLRDPRVNERFQRHLGKVNKGLINKYGLEIMSSGGDIPPDIIAYNLLRLERQGSDAVQLVDENGRVIPIQTPFYRHDAKTKKGRFDPMLIHPDVEAAIRGVCSNEEYDRIVDLEGFTPDLAKYSIIKKWSSREELIYQILIVNGSMKLGYESNTLEHREGITEVKKAERIADMLMANKGTPRQSRSPRQATGAKTRRKVA